MCREIGGGAYVDSEEWKMWGFGVSCDEGLRADTWPDVSLLKRRQMLLTNAQ